VSEVTAPGTSRTAWGKPSSRNSAAGIVPRPTRHRFELILNPGLIRVSCLRVHLGESRRLVGVGQGKSTGLECDSLRFRRVRISPYWVESLVIGDCDVR
jgi:hypothetical protein